MTEVENHWTRYFNDPERYEYTLHADGVFGAFRITDRTTGQVVSSGQACYSMEYLESLMTPEELATWTRCPDAYTPPGALSAMARLALTAPTQGDPHEPSDAS